MADHQTELINNSGRELPEDIMLAAADLVLRAEGGGDSYELGILCAGHEEMQRLNRIYRGRDSSTDILSFETARIPVKQGLETLHKVFCDIVIDINQISVQKGSNSFESELLKVLIHGLLHLCGYDHMTAIDRKDMETKEDYYKRKIMGVD